MTLNLTETTCTYCKHEIDEDHHGWGYSVEEDTFRFIFWHAECFEQEEGIAIA